MSAQASRQKKSDQEQRAADQALLNAAIEDNAMEQDENFTVIDKLESSGISSGDISKLKEAGYYTYESLAFTTRRELRNVKGISDQKAEKIMVSISKNQLIRELKKKTKNSVALFFKIQLIELKVSEKLIHFSRLAPKKNETISCKVSFDGKSTSCEHVDIGLIFQ